MNTIGGLHSNPSWADDIFSDSDAMLFNEIGSNTDWTTTQTHGTHDNSSTDILALDVAASHNPYHHTTTATTHTTMMLSKDQGINSSYHHSALDTTNFLSGTSTAIPSFNEDTCVTTNSGGSGHATEDVFDDIIRPLTDEDNDEVERGIELDLGTPSPDDTAHGVDAVTKNANQYQQYDYTQQYQQYNQYQQYQQNSPLTSSAVSGGSSPAGMNIATTMNTTAATTTMHPAAMMPRQQQFHYTTVSTMKQRSIASHLSIKHKPLKTRKSTSSKHYEDNSDDDADFKYSSGSIRKLQHNNSDGPARASQRLRSRSSMPRYHDDDEYVTLFDEDVEDVSPRNEIVTVVTRRGRRTTATAGVAASGGMQQLSSHGRLGRKNSTASTTTTINSGSRVSGTTSTTTAMNTTNNNTATTSAAAARTARRTAPAPTKTIRATSARHELKGRPSFSEIVQSGFMQPGQHKFSVGHVEVTADVGDDGAITYDGKRYRAVSKFALVVLRDRNPSRQSCDGWKEVAWNGEKLDALRSKVQQHVRQQARSHKAV